MGIRSGLYSIYLQYVATDTIPTIRLSLDRK